MGNLQWERDIPPAALSNLENLATTDFKANLGQIIHDIYQTAHVMFSDMPQGDHKKRACNLNPTLKTIAEIGGTTEKGQKMLTKDEVFPIYKAAKDSKDQGGFHDFVEILKLYDKNDDNTMLSHELFRLLTNLGERLTKEEAKSLMKELCEPADDEGFMPFIPFLERMCAAEK